MRPLPLVLLPLAALVLSQCGRTSTSELGGDAPASEVLATVAGRAITADDLREEAAWRVESRQPVPDAYPTILLAACYSAVLAPLLWSVLELLAEWSGMAKTNAKRTR